jgi:superfamily I DNA/RNA helicase
MFYSCEPDIIYEMMTAAGKKRCEYSFEIIKNKGIDYYVSKPQIIIGTIHSVKGGEADRVYLFPDLSSAAQKQWFSDAGRSAVIRTFYVGMTRTKDELILCQPATMRFIKWLQGK